MTAVDTNVPDEREHGARAPLPRRHPDRVSRQQHDDQCQVPRSEGAFVMHANQASVSLNARAGIPCGRISTHTTPRSVMGCRGQKISVQHSPL
jgi:hypothetical protein